MQFTLLHRIVLACVVVVVVVMLLVVTPVVVVTRKNTESPSGNGDATPIEAVTCASGTSQGPVQRPVLTHMQLRGQTSWFAAPLILDLDGDGTNELIACYYDCFIYSNTYELVTNTYEDSGRAYAPQCVVDLDGDGQLELVVGRSEKVFVYNYINRELVTKSGWPASTRSGGQSPEIRGMSCADLNRDGLIEVIVSTTQTTPSEDGGSQIFVFDQNGNNFQPIGGHNPAWPRYNSLTGPGNDQGECVHHKGYGAYGLNVGVGNIDDDDQLEILATYDNHHIQAFKADGVSLLASDYFTQRTSECDNERLTWGGFIRWVEESVEEAHYHLHEGEWPHPTTDEWLQWTASPPNVADIDGDGFNEVIGIPNVEFGEPYVTQRYAVMVLVGNQNNGTNGAMRAPGWEVLPGGTTPIILDGWYPPLGQPSPVIYNIQGDSRPEIIANMNDGYVYAFDADANQLWRVDYTHGKRVMYSSEPVIADLNQDGSPEILFSTYGAPDELDSGNIMVVSSVGEVLFDVPLPNNGTYNYNGNGNGAPVLSVGDLNGDGELEIFVQTFEHGCDVFTVPGSGTECMPWPTSRGGRDRLGQPTGY